MNGQLSIFDLTMPIFSINKRIRLIELFAGIGSQAMALRDLDVDFEHYRVVEFDDFAIKAITLFMERIFLQRILRIFMVKI